MTRISSAPRRALRGLLTASALATLAVTGAGAAAAQEALRSRLPIVVIDAAGPIVDDPKVSARMRIVHNDRGALNTPGGRPAAGSGPIGIELRGQSSLRFPKKQFGFETLDAKGENRNVRLLGLPEENDWILYAGYNDGTLLRNVVAYDAARRMGRYASRTRMVEVVLNGRYHGVYVLMEKLKLDKARVPEPEGSDGALVEFTHDSKLKPGDTFFRTPVTRTAVIYADPERGEIDRARARQIAAVVARFERALYGKGYRHPTRGWRAHADEAAMVDYVLLHEWLRNYDGFASSTFMHEGPGRKLVMGPLWDFDLSMGNPPDILPARGWMLADRRWTSRLYRDGRFVTAMQRRWTELRRDGFLGATRARIRRDAARLGPAQVRNLRRWPAVGAYTRPIDPGASEAALRAVYRTEVGLLTTWLDVRGRWITANLPRLARR